MIEIKLKDVLEAVQFGSLNALANQKMGAAVSFKVAKFVNKIQPELTTFNECKDKAFKEFATPKKVDGGEKEELELVGDNLESFKKQMDELINLAVKIDLQPILVTELVNIEIEPIHLSALRWMIKEE